MSYTRSFLKKPCSGTIFFCFFVKDRPVSDTRARVCMLSWFGPLIPFTKCVCVCVRACGAQHGAQHTGCGVVQVCYVHSAAPRGGNPPASLLLPDLLQKRASPHDFLQYVGLMRWLETSAL